MALAADGSVIGLNDNHAVDEVVDPNFAGADIEQAFWLQDRVGDGDPAKGGISTAAGTGYTDTVTLNSGAFDVDNIDETRDFFAWKEPGSPDVPGMLRGDGYGDLDAARTTGGAAGAQAMSRIKSVTADTIVVEDAIIPLGLTNAAWEVRRTAALSRLHGGDSNTNLDALGCCPFTGYFSHRAVNEDASRRFRVTRKVVMRLP
jgi:hypothetical protein